MTGKALAELRTEIELGMMVYSTTNNEVYRDEVDDYDHYDADGQKMLKTVYLFCTVPESETLCGDAMGYETLEDLIADWPAIASQPIWSTNKAVMTRRRANLV